MLKKILKSTFIYKKIQQKKEEKFLLEKEAYEKETLPLKETFYRLFVEKNDLVFDIGANIGNRIQPMLNIGARVVAIEPQASCVDILKQKFASKIIIENVGLGASDGKMEMFIANDSTISSFSKEFIEKTSKTRFKNYAWNKTIVVEIITLESLIEKYGIPKFCKIDVEGFELQVLQGLKTGIPNISFEYCVPEMSAQLMNCLTRLNEIDVNATFNFSIGESMELYFDKWLSYNEIEELVKTEKFIATSFGDIYFKCKA